MFQKKEETQSLIVPVKEWFIVIENLQEGPYSLSELKRDKRFTPDTWVWKKGFKEWVAARFVPEMHDVFKDESAEPQALHDPKKDNVIKPELGQPDQAILTMQQDPQPLLIWILILLLIILYTFYQLSDLP